MKMRHGQAALYLILVLVALTVLILMNTSAFLAVRAKNHAMNAGDAAALASARKQAELLNEIGRLNLRHAEAEWAHNWEEARDIVEKQQRIAFLGPLQCLREANEAARRNGAKASPEMSKILSRHVQDIRNFYITNPELFPEPWDGAWEEYARELSSIASEGIFAGCDNIEFLNAVECFPLSSKSFYSLIEGEAWCKLVVAGWTDLLNLDLNNLPPATKMEVPSVVNSEICSLHLEAKVLPPMDPGDLEDFNALLIRNGAVFPEYHDPNAIDDRPDDDISRIYFFYDQSRWNSWSDLISSAKLPLIGTVKPVFNVRGCFSIFRVYEDIPQLLADRKRLGTWNAAAKPFGTIETSSGRSIVTHEEAKGLVLPAYEAVRLVPIAIADGGNDRSTADGHWLSHVRDHIPLLYLNGASSLLPTCRYCASLLKWNNPEYRSRVSQWIDKNAESCRRPSPSGPGPTGGTSYAH
ncbi:MAG: hypothetical protein J6R80_03760 [Kiritimatiellae bacterium]|nr:hypothetical protein [Kiritimatiellia bacterium]